MIICYFDINRNKRSANKDKKKEELIKSRFIQLEDDIAKQREIIDNLKEQLENFAIRNINTGSGINNIQK